VELEKTLTVAAPLGRVWELLLDPKIMAGCVPGTQSVEVISDVEYVAEIRVKISFIAVRFKVTTKIVESQPPNYLRIEGTGEDSSVASSMKQSSELFLTDLGGGNTEIRIKAKADVLGRLGAFGLSVMKTKADRMWDEFGANFSAIVLRGADAGGGAPNASHPGAAVEATVQNGAAGVMDQASPEAPHTVSQPAPREVATAWPAQEPIPAKARWWQRIVGSSSTERHPLSEPRRATDIYVELHRPNGTIKVLWPASAASEAVRWLKDVH
jgi:carbon monoxide dehydrogenase subunit G